MPFIQINTSSKSLVDNDDLLQQDISKMVADLTGKPENYVMTMLQKDRLMTFAGSDEPCCFIKFKSIGSLTPSSMSKALCELISSKTNIKTNRIYIEFIDVKASNWGFNSSTFG
ncbi:phenylpyruvate tautomerase MIF-related protein [Prochlorococcus marinus]|uniref:L-dopachrome isomerase n=1 Tax=Prochlorococcus marinus XMU1408 TaxID=2213228 RepID=A0A318R053_PROMR|nr:phenylpyruvate tautomerase MIF-related protein [Prochlorococcus marinus]MBW3042322.1 light-inducible protein [Prochlorococcus marinus str. XMU1408]PYE01707.1 light-inducible protein [Prochlorococcus marinus XMU1408]